MENALNNTNLPTFQTNKSKSHQNPLMGSALQESLPTSRGIRRKRAEYLNKTQNKENSSEDEVEVEDEDEKVEVKRKIVALQRIVPGGEALGVDKLFEETAGYILALQCQIKAMRVVTSFIEGLEKQKTKFGG